MKSKGWLRGGDESACRYDLRGRTTVVRKPDGLVRYNLRGRLVMIRRTGNPKDRIRAKKAPTVTREAVTTSRATAEERKGTPFPRWMFPGIPIRYPFITVEGEGSTWPSCKEHQRAIMERTVLPYVPLALQLCHQDDALEFEFVRMVDICKIFFHGTVFNLKFEAKPFGSVDNESSSRIFFAQIHFADDPTKKGHINRCCLYDPDMPDVPFIHADCLACFPDPSEGYEHRGAGKHAAAVLNRVVRVTRNLPIGVPPYACYYMTKQERNELLHYHASRLAKLALEEFKIKAQDAGLEFAGVVRARFFVQPAMMFNIKFKVRRMNSVDPKLFLAQVHRIGQLYHINCDKHVSVCGPYDPNVPGFPPNCVVCDPRSSKVKHKYTEI